MSTYYTHDELQYRWRRPDEYWKVLAQDVYDKYTRNYARLYKDERAELIDKARNYILREYGPVDYDKMNGIIEYSIDHCYDD